MIVEQLIKQLQNMPHDLQVMDSYGSPIYWIAKKPKGAVPNGEGVYLETVSDMDIKSELDAVFKHASENNLDEYDVFLQLGENGLILKDFEGTKYYEKAKEYSKTHDWEWHKS